MARAACFAVALCALTLVANLPASAGGPRISFKKTVLDNTFRSEGVAVGDFNHDGKLDIAAGSVYYAAPDWKMHLVAEQAGAYEPKSYSNSFCNFADDVNGDGWTDLLVVDFPSKQTWWWENPRGEGSWVRHACIEVTNNESPTYLDIDGDGRRELICSTGGTAGNRYIIARPYDDPRALWQMLPVSDEVSPRLAFKYYHGLGVGDINHDDRNDVIIPDGWWEAPPVGGKGSWKFHATTFGAPEALKVAQMYAYDFDGDGDNDVLSSSAHAFGIWWHEQTADGWKLHEIDTSYSQTHSLCLADINGDGLPDFVTGKRWWAHGGHDPGGDGQAVLFWYELSRRDGRPVWTPHQIDHDSGVGTQFEVADLNGDGLLDVVSSNKKGVRFFLQERK